ALAVPFERETACRFGRARAVHRAQHRPSLRLPRHRRARAAAQERACARCARGDRTAHRLKREAISLLPTIIPRERCEWLEYFRVTPAAPPDRAGSRFRASPGSAGALNRG